MSFSDEIFEASCWDDLVVAFRDEGQDLSDMGYIKGWVVNDIAKHQVFEYLEENTWWDLMAQLRDVDPIDEDSMYKMGDGYFEFECVDSEEDFRAAKQRIIDHMLTMGLDYPIDG